jgi:hypothetical protein
LPIQMLTALGLIPSYAPLALATSEC